MQGRNFLNQEPAASKLLTALEVSLADFSRRKKYLVGVSGGRDSMALLHGLVRSGFRNLVVCHLDHRLRGGVSAADAIFVTKETRKLGVRLIRGEADVAGRAATEKQSIETAAREERHHFFASCARAENCNRIFLGHHAEDQLETILHHFFRGSGRRGLGGMRFESTITVGRKRLVFLRPLLSIKRADINEWVEDEGILWREDASNSSPAHSRNRLRNELVPALESILGRNFRAPILRAATVLAAEDEWIESQVTSLPFSASAPNLPVSELRGLGIALQRRVVLQWLRSRKITDAGFKEVESVLSLLETGESAPARVNLPGNFHACRRAGKIFIFRPG